VANCLNITTPPGRCPKEFLSRLQVYAAIFAIWSEGKQTGAVNDNRAPRSKEKRTCNVAPLSAILCSKRLITRDKVMKTYDDYGNEVSRRHYELHVWKEYQLYDCGTAELMQAIRNDFPDRPLIVFPDPTGDSRKTSAPVGQTDFTIIRSFGADIFVPRFRTNSDKYNHVNGMLCNTLGIRRLLINPRACPRLVESLDGLQIKNGTNLADKNSGFCHLSDALAYAVIGLFPIPTGYGAQTVVQI
jgi:hypothetical protein